MLKGSQRHARQVAAIGSKFNQKERSAIAKKAAAGRWQ